MSYYVSGHVFDNISIAADVLRQALRVTDEYCQTDYTADVYA
jgi:hypothetical protein